VKKAEKEAKEKTYKCQCDTKFKHESANKKAHTIDEANMKAWAMAHKLECVLNKQAVETCKIPSLPVVKAPTLAPEVVAAKCTATIGLPPTNPCDKWREEHKANQEIAAALKGEVSFDANVVALSAQGKRTLDLVAQTLNKYTWMAVSIQAHSSASPGSGCNDLVNGRAKSTKDYLTKKGVANTMNIVKGTCGNKKAITISGQQSIDNPAGAGKPPAGCKA